MHHKNTLFGRLLMVLALLVLLPCLTVKAEAADPSFTLDKTVLDYSEDQGKPFVTIHLNGRNDMSYMHLNWSHGIGQNSSAIWNAGNQTLKEVPVYDHNVLCMGGWSFDVWLSGKYDDGTTFSTARQTVTVKHVPVDIEDYSTSKPKYLDYNGKDQYPYDTSPISWDYGTCFYVLKYTDENGTVSETECTEFKVKEPGTYALHLARRYDPDVVIGNVGRYSPYGTDGRTFVSNSPYLQSVVKKAELTVSAEFYQENYVYGNQLRENGKLLDLYFKVTSVKDVFGQEMDPSQYTVTYGNYGYQGDYLEASNTYSFYAEVTPVGDATTHYQTTKKYTDFGAKYPTPATVTASGSVSSSGKDYDGVAVAASDIASVSSAKFTRKIAGGTETINLTASDYSLKLRRQGTKYAYASVTDAGTYDVVMVVNNSKAFQFPDGSDTLVLGTYTINPLQATASVTAKTGLVYNTKAQDLCTVTVKDSAGNALPQSAYSVSYSTGATATNAGTYTNTVTVTSTNYALNGGSTTATFSDISTTIDKYLLGTVSVHNASVSYDGQPHSISGTPMTVTDASGTEITPEPRFPGYDYMVYPVTAHGHTYYLYYTLDGTTYTDVGSYPYTFSIFSGVLYQKDIVLDPDPSIPTTTELMKNYLVNIDTTTRFTITKSQPTIKVKDSYVRSYAYGSLIPVPAEEEMDLKYVSYSQLHFDWLDSRGNPMDTPTAAGTHPLKVWTEDCNNTYYASTMVDVTITRSTSAVQILDSYSTSYSYGDSIPLPTAEQMSITGAYYNDVTFSWTNSDGANVAAPKDAGSYTLTATIAESDNCTASTTSVDITIHPRTVTVSGITAMDKVYDAKSDAALDYSSLQVNGAQYGETLSVTATGTFSDKHVGTDKTVTISDLVLVSDSANLDNYTLDVAGSQETATANINAKELEVTLDVSAVTKVYDGQTTVSQEQAALVGITLTGFADDADEVRVSSYSYTYSDPNADTDKTLSANLTLEGKDVGNYCLPQTVTGTGAAIIPFETTLTIGNQTITYGDSLQSELTNITVGSMVGTEVITGVTLKTDNRDVTDSGVITLDAVLVNGSEEAAENYRFAVTDGVLTIERRPVHILGIQGKERVYDGTTDYTLDFTNIQIVNLVDGDDLIVTARGTTTDASLVPTKHVTAAKAVITELTIHDGETGKASNYLLMPNQSDTEIPAKILPLEITFGVTAADKQYDGTDAAQITDAWLIGVLDGDTVNLEKGTASFSSIQEGENISILLENFSITGADAGNYDLKTPENVTADIYNTYDASEYVLSPATWTNGVVTLTANDNHVLSSGNTLDSQWEEELTFSTETDKDGADYDFYLRSLTTGAISRKETVTYFIDKTDPTGSITLTETTGLRKLVKALSFGLFFKDAQTVVIEAEDSLSGIGSIEYYETDTVLTQSQVEAITDWKTYPAGGVNVELEDGKHFIYLARITDVAGNVIYLSTGGAVYDTTAPQVGGVQDGGVYYVSQTVTVTELNPNILTLNGEDVTAPFTLKGNENATYEIVAEDKAGNVTTVTVTMKPISDLDDAIEDLTEDTATSDNAEDVNEALDTYEDLLQDPDTTEEEKEQLREQQSEAEKLQDAIEEAAADIATEEIQKTKDVTKDTVRHEDRKDLEQAKQDLKDALKEHPENYTDKEQKDIKEEIQRIDEALDSLEDAEDAEKRIRKLPDEVETDLPEAQEKSILAVKKLYDNLTAHEKELLSKESRKKLESLVKTLTDYKITKGSGSHWVQDSILDLNFSANGPDRKFKSLLVDGKEVSSKYFTHDDGAKGGTVITLKASYLQKLSFRKHKLQIVYTDGQTNTVSFRVMYNSENPLTGDTFHPALAGGICLFSGTALLYLLLKKRNACSR